MENNNLTLADSVEVAVKRYLGTLEGHEINDLYEVVLREIELSLLGCVMEHTRNNQSKAAILLGLNRGTLREKLKKYGML